MALATLGALSWRLTRPALWLDEGATAMATQRSWPNLWLLLRGSDSPLVPYYALLKLLTTATTNVFPHAAEHPELFYRWPSVAAAVIAVWVLTVWVARHLPILGVLGTGVFILASAGFSRYGQEARPYAVVLMAAVISTVLLTRLIAVRRKRWIAVYGLAYSLSLALLIAANTLSAALIAAHLVAALVGAERGRRWWALLRTVVFAAIGVGGIARLVLTVTTNGKGASEVMPVTADRLYLVFLHLFTSDLHPLFWVGPLLPLSFLGLTRINSAKYWSIARIAGACAVIPPLVLLPAVIARPNLLIGRYTLFVLPFWGVLAGLGAITLFELARRVLRFQSLAALLTLAVLAAVAVGQRPSVEALRMRSGHGEDIRPALAMATNPRYANLPVYVATVLGSVEVGAYAPGIEDRMLSVENQRDQTMIWPNVEPPDLRKARLLASPEILLLMRVGHAPGCMPGQIAKNAASVERCMPPMLQHLDYKVETIERRGRNWTAAVLTRVVVDRPLTAMSANPSFVRR